MGLAAWYVIAMRKKGALDRAAALEGVELTRSSLKVQVPNADGGTKAKTLQAWRGVGIAI